MPLHRREIKKRIRAIVGQRNLPVNTEEGFVEANDIAMFRCYESDESAAAKEKYWPEGVKPGTYVAMTDGRLLRTDYEIADLESIAEQLQGKFLMTGTRYIVNMAHVEGVYKHKEYFLQLKGAQEPAKVSKGKYVRRVKKALGVKTLDHLVPDTKYDKKLRELGIYEFGTYEAIELDRSDPEAVKAYINDWEFRQYTYERLCKYFSRKYKDEVNILQMCLNHTWQLYRWIKWGIADPYYFENVRGLWYDIQAVVEHHMQLPMRLSDSTFNTHIDELIARNRLVRYSDFGFKDDLRDKRRMGKEVPQLLLFSEKKLQFGNIYRMAKPYGISCACSWGQPSRIVSEYMGIELEEAGVDLENETIHIFMLSDFDAAGFKIRECMKSLLLEETSARYIITHDIFTLDILDDEELYLARSKGPHFTYAPGGKKKIPFPRTNKKKAYFKRETDWWESLKEPDKSRLHDVQEYQGKNIHTVLKVSVDSLDWDETVIPVFQKMVEDIKPTYRKWHDVLAKLRSTQEDEVAALKEKLEALAILEGECEDEHGVVRSALDQALKVCAKELVIDQLIQASKRDKDDEEENEEPPREYMELIEAITRLLDRFAPEAILEGWRRVARKQLLSKKDKEKTTAKKSVSIRDDGTLQPPRLPISTEPPGTIVGEIDGKVTSNILQYLEGRSPALAKELKKDAGAPEEMVLSHLRKIAQAEMELFRAPLDDGEDR